MAWRPNANFQEGELDNRTPGKVAGYVRFYREGRSPLRVTLDLEGDFHADIAGYRVRLRNPEEPREAYPDAAVPRRSYMDGFEPRQRGVVGDMTAGWEVNGAAPYVPWSYFEWYGPNYRVVLESAEVTLLDGGRRLLSPDEIAAAATRRRAAFDGYMRELARGLGESHGRQEG